MKYRTLPVALLVLAVAPIAYAASPIIPTNGLVLYYDFNADVSTVPDRSGHANAATVRDATWISSGLTGGAYHFNGISSYMTAPTEHFPVGAAGISYSVWLRPENNSGADCRVLEYGAAENGRNFNLYIDSNRYAVDYWGGQKVVLTRATIGTWSHVVLSSDGSRHLLYVNGRLASSGTHALNLGNNGVLQIGRYMAGAHFYSGDMDELRIYGRTLTSDEVQNIYLAGGGTLQPAVPPEETEDLPPPLPEPVRRTVSRPVMRPATIDMSPPPSSGATGSGSVQRDNSVDLTYVPSAPNSFGISPAALVLKDPEKVSLANELCSWACRKNPDTAGEMSMASRLIGLSLLLCPDNKHAVVANARLSAGKKFTLSTTATNERTFAGHLYATATTLMSAKGIENLKLAGELLSIASEVAPDNDDVTYQLVLFNKAAEKEHVDIKGKNSSGTSSDWGPKPHPDYVTKAKSFVRAQSSIKGLFIQQTMTGQSAGQAIDIIASIYPLSQGIPGKFELPQSVGEDMQISWAEAIRAVKIRYPFYESGKQVTFSFGDKYSAKDGGSAGLAFCILLLSLTDGFEIDQAAAITGDITVDWKIRPVGGVADKIRGATLDRCKYVVLPTCNETQVYDAFILYPGLLTGAQVISVETVGDAIKLMKSDKTETTMACLEKFERIQRTMSRKGIVAAQDADFLANLKAIEQGMPNHLTAKALRKRIEKKNPETLSFGTSVEQAVNPAIIIVVAEDMSYPERVQYFGDLSKDVIVSSRKQLEMLFPLIDPKAKSLLLSATELVKAAEQYRNSTNSPAAADKAFLRACAAYSDEIQKLQLDKSFLESLLR